MQNHLLLSDLTTPPNLSHSLVGSGENSTRKMTRPDKSMTTSSSSSSMPSPSSASGHNSMGGSSTFDLTTVMKKIENAGSSSSWTKVIS